MTHAAAAPVSKVYELSRVIHASTKSSARSEPERPAVISNQSQRRPESVVGVACPVFARFEPT